MPEALFNRASCLQRLFLKEAALAAWEDYLRVDADSPWAAEAIGRKAEGLGPSRSCGGKPSAIRCRPRAWRGTARRSPGSSPGIRRRPEPGAEGELLGRWAQATRDGQLSAATEALATAHGLGDALAGFSGDRLLQETVTVLEGAAGKASRGDLLAGHLAYQEGLKKMSEPRDLEGARAKLEEAYRRLDRAGSPFALWALFQLGFRQFLERRQPEQALVLLGSVCRLAEGTPYKSLAGRAWWLKGTTFLYLARYSEALAAFRKSQAYFEETREANYLAGIHTLLAAPCSPSAICRKPGSTDTKPCGGPPPMAAPAHNDHRCRRSSPSARRSELADRRPPHCPGPAWDFSPRGWRMTPPSIKIQRKGKLRHRHAVGQQRANLLNSLQTLLVIDTEKVSPISNASPCRLNWR